MNVRKFIVMKTPPHHHLWYWFILIRIVNLLLWHTIGISLGYFRNILKFLNYIPLRDFFLTVYHRNNFYPVTRVITHFTMSRKQSSHSEFDHSELSDSLMTISFASSKMDISSAKVWSLMWLMDFWVPPVPQISILSECCRFPCLKFPWFIQDKKTLNYF